jgi:secondary thiamine-phosphate synthase enzyme
MTVQTQTFKISTKGNNDIIDITSKVKKEVGESKVEDGAVTVFMVGSTIGVTTMEYEPGQIQDLKDLLETLVPRGKDWQHNYSSGGGDGNGHAHLRASLLGPSLTIPLIKGALSLGTWQQIVAVDFDIRPRSREVIVQIVGN